MSKALRRARHEGRTGLKTPDQAEQQKRIKLDECSNAPFFSVVATGNYRPPASARALEISENEIYLITKWNKEGPYWWGIDAYRPDRQGLIWTKGMQPYTGDLPEEASDIAAKLRSGDL